jgi:hypothetical protein
MLNFMNYFVCCYNFKGCAKMVSTDSDADLCWCFYPWTSVFFFVSHPVFTPLPLSSLISLLLYQPAS